MSIEQLLTTLSRMPPPPNCCNPYRGNGLSNQLRLHNLRLYLQQMYAKKPTTVLVGEAPGYRGCRLTGIPFTSPHILQTGIPSFDLFGIKNGYKPAGEWDHIQKESSATMMWQALSNFSQPPLLWNVFPLHPHKPQNPQSNRTPTRRELAMGRPFLPHLLELFPIRQIIAVGNKADDTLTRRQLPHHKVRHPSHGGKREFIAGLQKHLTNDPASAHNTPSSPHSHAP